MSTSFHQAEFTPERVNELSRAFWNSAILRAGIKLGIFPMLDSASMTAKETATHLNASPRFTKAFLNACVVLGLLEEKEGSYFDSPLAKNFLVPGRPGYVGDLVLHITNFWHVWGQLDELVRRGETVLPFETGFVSPDTFWNNYMIGQHNRAVSGQGRELADHVDLTGRRKLLDLGGGAASYSIALCKANPELHAVVIDQREPLEIAQGFVREQGLTERITLQEGDFNTRPLGNDSDVVLISGVVLIKGEEECRRLFSRSYQALVPGGMIIVQDFMRIDPSPQRHFLDTLMDLYVLIGFDPGAGDRSGDEVAGWLSDTGFTKIEQTALPTHLALVTAVKP